MNGLRLLAVIALASVGTACGGGGGDDDGGGGNTETGQIAATVLDQFDAPINGVRIEATIGNTTRAATTGSDGTVTVAQVPTGSVSVTATAEGLVEPPAQTVDLAANETEQVTFRLQRVTEATGGISAAVREGALDPEGDSFTFRLRVIVIDENFDPVPGLTATAFSLADCTPVQPEFPERPDCVRFNAPVDDAPYTVANATPAGFQEITDPPGPVPYAVGLLFDSSESIGDSDPTDARIFAAKEYLNDVDTGDGNSVMLAAFADGADALIPEPPVTYFPCQPCTPDFLGNGNSLFASLDSLATLEGGGTPLYDSLEEMVVTVGDTAPTNLRRAAVLFSDGKDIYCAEPPGSFQFCTQRRGEVVTASGAVDIFTIGLSDNVDSLAMAELALRDGGAYMFAERPTQLISIFGTLDRLLSDNMPSYEMVWTVNGEPGVFAGGLGRAVIGELTVDTGAASFTLPFVVQIE